MGKFGQVLKKYRELKKEKQKEIDLEKEKYQSSLAVIEKHLNESKEQNLKL